MGSQEPQKQVISIHAPTRGATLIIRSCYLLIQFQSTLPQGERQGKLDGAIAEYEFQSTLPQGERQHPDQTAYQQHTISIHAPTRGATIVYTTYSNVCTISIHAPTRGATGIRLVVRCVLGDFNPRSHKGSDDGRSQTSPLNYEFQSTLPQGERLMFIYRPHRGGLISIHAPTRGATTISTDMKEDFVISIHAPTRGATQGVSLFSPSGDFNPRSHKGSDIGNRCHLHDIVYFNPRSHKGSDGDKLNNNADNLISIHAPTRGATTGI